MSDIERLSPQAISTLEDFREQWHAAKRMHARAEKRYDALPVSWGREPKRDAALSTLDKCAENVALIERAMIMTVIQNPKPKTKNTTTK